MAGISFLWRVAGSVPIPREADDRGLVSRVADVFEQANWKVLEDTETEVRFGGFFSRFRRFAARPRFLTDAGLVRREFNEKGRSLRYELRTLHLVPAALAESELWRRVILDFWGLAVDPRLFIVVTPCIYLLHHWGLRRSIPRILKRAFET